MSKRRFWDLHKWRLGRLYSDYKAHKRAKREKKYAEALVEDNLIDKKNVYSRSADEN